MEAKNELIEAAKLIAEELEKIGLNGAREPHGVTMGAIEMLAKEVRDGSILIANAIQELIQVIEEKP